MGTAVAVAERRIALPDNEHLERRWPAAEREVAAPGVRKVAEAAESGAWGRRVDVSYGVTPPISHSARHDSSSTG